MASKSNIPAGQPAKSKSTRKSATPAAVAADAAPAQPKPPGGAKGLLRAGLKALNDVRDDVITRQSRVFEALLGIDSSRAGSDRSAREWKLLHGGDADALGVQKFEEVFDQRVARSLERLGMPSPQALAALCQQLEAINEHLQRIESPPKKRAAPRRSIKP